MRVLHLVKTSVGGQFAFRQMRRLVKLGVEVHVAVPEGPMVPKYTEAGIQVHAIQFDFPISAPWRWPAMKGAFLRLVDEIKPDIIHSHFVGTTLTMRLALGNKVPIPRVFNVPGTLHLESLFFQRAEFATANKYDYWIGSCKWICDCYRKLGVSERHIFMTYYGSEIDVFGVQEKGKLRKELGLAPDIQIVGMVAFIYAPKYYLGQTQGLKGHEDLIDAIKICREVNPNIVGVFVGGPWKGADRYEIVVKEYAKKHCNDGVIFLGTRQDVADLYADFDVAVHPSHSESLGGAAESLLHGVPTIATSVGGLTDIVINDETGWLVPPKCPKELAIAILESLADTEKCKRMTQQGQKFARRVLDVRENAKQIYAAYQQIIADHAK
ncbi:MAG: glycosyltransferase family 4 protein [bacterium]